MRDRLKKIMSVVFEVDPASLNEKSTPDTVETWDSIRHINLVTALEEEFKIRFSDEEIVQLLSMDAIIASLEHKTTQA